MRRIRRLLAACTAFILLIAISAAPAQAQQGTQRRPPGPVYVSGDNALTVLGSTLNTSVVAYNLSWDGKSRDLGYLSEHVHTDAIDYSSILFIPSEELAKVSETKSILDLMRLPPDTLAGTGMNIVFYNPKTREAVVAQLCVLGDVTGSGKMELSQIIEHARMLSDTERGDDIHRRAGDWNGNGVIDLADLTTEAQLLFASRAEPLGPADFRAERTNDPELAPYGSDILAYLQDTGESARFYYYDPAGELTDDVVSAATRRGLGLGSHAADMWRAYGIRPLFAYGIADDWLSDAARKSDGGSTLDLHCCYFAQYMSEDESLQINFYFDQRARIILMAFGMCPVED